MDDDYPGPLAPLEQTSSHRLGPVEPGDGAGALLCVDRRQCLPGDLAGPQRTRRVPAVARVLLRDRRQTRALPVRARRRALLWTAAGLGRGAVGGLAGG